MKSNKLKYVGKLAKINYQNLVRGGFAQSMKNLTFVFQGFCVFTLYKNWIAMGC